MKLYKRALAIMLSLLILVSFTQLSVTVDAASYSNGYTGAMAGDGKIHTEGIDVSRWQQGTVNFTDVKNAGYTYVILRCGTSSGKDVCFEDFYSQAKAAGLNVGVYYYSYATTVAESIKDAEKCLSWIEGKKFEYPVYFDYEDETQEALGGTLSAQICYAFLDKIKEAGYLPGLYSMASWLEQSWVTTSGLRNDYEGWIARYMNSGTYEAYGSIYSTQYGMYQYTSNMTINGKGPFDANICYKDYPSIIKKYGFNGYEAENSLKNNETQKKVKPYVFDAEFYADRYSDVRIAFGDDEEKLYDHFLDYGIKEGRCASPYFDVAWYMTQNDQGLIDYCNGDYEKAYDHFLEYVENPNEMTGTPKKLSKILDINYYMNQCRDLRNAGWTTEYDYLEHFAKYGVNEWRQGSAEFDPISYAYFNGDLFSAYGSENVVEYYEHYMHTGQFETHNPAREKTFNTANYGDSFYATISEINTGKVFELVYGTEFSSYDDKNAVQINTANGTDSQLWKFERQSDGTYLITNVAYNKLLDFDSYYLGARDKIDGLEGNCQKWIIYDYDGNCVLKTIGGTPVLDCAISFNDYSPLIQETFNNSPNQKFRINKVDVSIGILGDVNNDGTISIMDATLIQQSLAGLVSFTDHEKLRADVDSNENLAILDVTNVQRYLAQYEVSVPIGQIISTM